MTRPRRLSRRTFVAGGAVGGGALAAGIGLAVTRPSRRQAAGPSLETPSPPATAQPPATPTVTPLPAGGTARLGSPARFSFDTFDALRTGEPAVFEVLGRTHSRLVQWTDFASASMAGDLALEWEQPDATTLILTLDPAARWHDRPPLDGRPVVASDVAAHFNRLLTLPGAFPLLQRRWDFANIRTVLAPDESTVVFETAGPDPFLLHSLAARSSVVQAPEAVDAFGTAWHEIGSAHVVGSGPFRFDRVGDTLVFSAHRSGHRPPHLDGITLRNSGRVVDPFLAHELDEALVRDRRDAAAIREAAPEAIESARFEDSPVISTVFTGAPPWDHPGLRRALSAALNRGELARRLFAGRAAPAGPVPPAFAAFIPPDSELQQFPGYRPDYAQDVAEARSLWQAAGGDAYPELRIDFPAIFDPLYSASSIVPAMLREALGVRVRPAVESYTTIAAKSRDRAYGNGAAATWFGWGPPIFEPDPSRHLLETHHSASATAAEHGYASPAIDSLLDSVASEFDLEQRQSLIREVSPLLLTEGGGAAIPWVQQWSELFRWPYAGGSPSPSPLSMPHLDAGRYLDPSHPLFSRRPA